MLTNYKAKMLAYLPEIIKITIAIFEKYSDANIVILHDITYLLTKNYEECFKTLEVVEELIQCIIKNLYEKIHCKDYLSINYILDLIPSIINTKGYNVFNYINEIFSAIFEIISFFHLQYAHSQKEYSIIDKELINKCLDLISAIYSAAPKKMLEFKNKNLIVENILKLLEIPDNYIKHFVIAVIGDIGKIDENIFINQIQKITEILMSNLDLNESNKLDSVEIDKLSVCNNSCWTIGLLATTYSQYMGEFMKQIMKKLIKILTQHSKVMNNLILYFQN